MLTLVQMWPDEPLTGVADEKANTVAQFYGPNAEEYARLFTVAPQLLALAEELRQALADHHYGWDTTRPLGTTYNRDHKLLDRVSEAIAKAKGEE